MDATRQFICDEITAYQQYYLEYRSVEQGIVAAETAIQQLQLNASADAQAQRRALQVKHGKLKQELQRIDLLMEDLCAYIKRLLIVTELPVDDGYNELIAPSQSELKKIQDTVENTLI